VRLAALAGAARAMGKQTSRRCSTIRIRACGPTAAARSPAHSDQLARMLESADRTERFAALAVAGAAHAALIARASRTRIRC
jgi:hypothetical protein